MSKYLSALLEQFWRELIRMKPSFVELLQPGLSRAEIEERIGAMFENIPSEIYELYEWKNGVKGELANSRTIGEIELFSLGIFPSLEESIETYQNYTAAGSWSKHLFPLFESGGGDFFLTSLDKTVDDSEAIYFYSPSDYTFTNVTTIYDSLPNMIVTIMECYRKKAYFFNLDNTFNSDPDLEFEISARNNPASKYWKLLL